MVFDLGLAYCKQNVLVLLYSLDPKRTVNDGMAATLADWPPSVYSAGSSGHCLEYDLSFSVSFGSYISVVHTSSFQCRRSHDKELTSKTD